MTSKERKRNVRSKSYSETMPPLSMNSINAKHNFNTKKLIKQSENPKENGLIKYKSYKNNFFKKIKITSREASEEADEVLVGEVGSS